MDLYTNNFPSIYRGVVESNEDPMQIGRCKVRIPSIHGDSNIDINVIPWARPIASSPVKLGKGNLYLPDVGDIVWVMFEGADKYSPVYFGGTYAVDEIPMDRDKIVIYLEDNNSIMYDRVSKRYMISVGNNYIEIDGGSIALKGNVHINGNVHIEGDLTVSGTYPCDAD